MNPVRQLVGVKVAGDCGVGDELLVVVVPGRDWGLLVVPVGAGGLITGCAVAATAIHPGIRIVGVEPQAGDDISAVRFAELCGN